MKKKIKALIFGNLLIKGSLVVLIGATLANFGAYLYHLFMGRMLGPQDYGVLESLLSLTYFLNVPLVVLSLVLVKFISQESSHQEKISLFLKNISQKLSLWGLVGLLAFLAAFPFWRGLLKVNSFWLFLGVGLFAFLGIFQTILSASLQGTAEFAKLSFLNVFGSLAKLLLAILLVLGGFQVGGAVYALVLAIFFSILVGYKLLPKELDFALKGKISLKASFEKIERYCLSVFVSSLCLTSFYTVDVLLARYFLSPLQAGYYAALSVLGKVIFFASFPVVQVMFPLVSKHQTEGKDYQRMAELSFIMVLGLSVSISLAYFLFPQLVINLLFGSKYLGIVSSLGAFAIFISLYSLCSLLVNFYLSISETKAVIMPALAAILQIGLIACYHADIAQIIKVNIFSMSLLLVGLLSYFYFLKTKKIKAQKIETLSINSPSKV